MHRVFNKHEKKDNVDYTVQVLLNKFDKLALKSVGLCGMICDVADEGEAIKLLLNHFIQFLPMMDIYLSKRPLMFAGYEALYSQEPFKQMSLALQEQESRNEARYAMSEKTNQEEIDELGKKFHLKMKSMQEKHEQLHKLNDKLSSNLSSSNAESRRIDIALTAMDDALAARDIALAAKNDLLVAKDKEIAALDKEIAAKDKEIAANVKELARQHNELAAIDKKIAQYRQMEHTLVGISVGLIAICAVLNACG